MYAHVKEGFIAQVKEFMPRLRKDLCPG